MAAIKVRYQVEDGYHGGDRPQTMTVESSDFEGMSKDEVSRSLQQQVEEHMMEHIYPVMANEDDIVELIMDTIATDAAEDDEGCEGCGDGDKVPAKGYWRCPKCDAEWNEEETDES